MSQTIHPDQYWRESHGHSRDFAPLAHVVLRFIALGCSEADRECLLSLQKGIQVIHGMIYGWQPSGHVFFSYNPGKLAIQ
jgi:hypothetical protein